MWHKNKARICLLSVFIMHLNTLGAFSDFSFLTTSPCCATRSYRPKEEGGGKEEEVAVTGDEAEGASVTIPGL